MKRERICDDYLTINEARIELGVSKTTLYEMIKAGLPVKRINKSPRIKRQDLIDYIEKPR